MKNAVITDGSVAAFPVSDEERTVKNLCAEKRSFIHLVWPSFASLEISLSGAWLYDGSRMRS